jgi:anthranilate phosphoribosyltransferase
MSITTAINLLIERRDLTQEQMTSAMREVMTGAVTPAQVAGFLVALRMKGETVTEIAAAAQVMRDLATKVNINVNRKHLVDTCGTGGDSAGIFNVSTASAFVVAAAGGKVAKHGNRSITSKCGSADLLEHAGVKINIKPEQVARCVEELDVGFMFSINHHGAMKHAIGPRRELGIRTIFNVLGPLTNPAAAPNQVMGVYAKYLVRPIAEVLKLLGSEHVLVVHSSDGLDEISIAAETFVAELKDGKVTEYTVTPEQFKVTRGTLDALKVATVEQSLEKVKAALTDTHSPEAAIVSLNAGAAIYAANLCATFAQGVHMAEDIIGTGLAYEKLKELVSFTEQLEHLNA